MRNAEHFASVYSNGQLALNLVNTVECIVQKLGNISTDFNGWKNVSHFRKQTKPAYRCLCLRRLVSVGWWYIDVIAQINDCLSKQAHQRSNVILQRRNEAYSSCLVPFSLFTKNINAYPAKSARAGCAADPSEVLCDINPRLEIPNPNHLVTNSGSNFLSKCNEG